MSDRILADLIGTLKTYFRFGNLRLKDNSGVLEAKNKADTAYANVAAAGLVLQGATSGVTTLTPADEQTESWELPDADGSTGQAMVTDGSGKLSFATVATGSNAVKSETETVVFDASSPITIFTPPASAHILTVIADVETAFDATGASLSVGIAGTTTKYMGATDNDLAIAAVYEVSPNFEEDETPDAVIITFSAGTGGSAGAAKVKVIYANPG